MLLQPFAVLAITGGINEAGLASAVLLGGMLGALPHRGRPGRALVGWKVSMEV